MCLAKFDDDSFWLFRQVTNSDGVHQATISKKWIGCCHESFLDADNFAVEFVDILSADQRAMILSASFLIDLMYYEEQGGAAAWLQMKCIPVIFLLFLESILPRSDLCNILSQIALIFF